MNFSRRGFSLVIFLLLTYNLAFCQDKITVAVAANMQYPAIALLDLFSKKEHISVEIVAGSSGKLAQQIVNSAPFDLFISADTAFPWQVYKAGFATELPKVYARGLLVLWTIKKGILLKPDLKFLTGNQIKSVALPNPKTAPYGFAAERLLQRYQVYDLVKNKLVFGESVTQASQFVATGAADVGFTARSVVLSNEMKGKGAWIDLDPKDYPPIRQAAVLLKYGKKHHPTAAQKFYDFLYSREAKDIFKKFGYII